VVSCFYGSLFRSSHYFGLCLYMAQNSMGKTKRDNAGVTVALFWAKQTALARGRLFSRKGAKEDKTQRVARRFEGARGSWRLGVLSVLACRTWRKCQALIDVYSEAALARGRFFHAKARRKIRR
jgi:hypothetical protein